jgi:hypothetical protein
VGVDTYLGPPQTPRPVQVQRSVLGLGDRLIGPVVLDPRLSGVPAAGISLVLDGGVAPPAAPASPAAPANPNPGRGWPAG